MSLTECGSMPRAALALARTLSGTRDLPLRRDPPEKLLRRPTWAGLRLAARNLAGPGLYGALPAALAVLFVYYQVQLGVFQFDFAGTVWEPARDMLSGRSPYPEPRPEAVDVGNPAVYPPSILLVAAPFALLPFGAASVLWFGLLLAAVPATLWLLDVRDWRCHTVALASFPVLHGAVFGNVTLLLLPAVALAWRYRDRVWAVAAAVAFVVAMKLFLWPLLVWLVVTRRFRALAAAGAGAAVTVLGTWAAIGFEGFAEYPQLLEVLTGVFAGHSESVFAGSLAAGLSEAGAERVAIGAGAALLAAAALLARRTEGDRRAFSLALAASFVFSPIVWPHYYVLLLVPIALLRPRLSKLWAVIPLFWLVSYGLPFADLDGVPCCGPRDTPAAIWKPLHAAPPVWQIAGYTALLALVTFVVVVWRRPRTPVEVRA